MSEDQTCFICGDDIYDVEEMIGIEFNDLDHPDKENIYLCDECIDGAAKALEERRFKNKVVETLNELNEDD